MYKKYTSGWMKHLDFIFIDEIALQLSLLAASLLRFRNLDIYSNHDYIQLILLSAFIDLAVFILFNTMSGVLKRGYYKEFIATIRHTSIVFAAILAYMFALQSGKTYSRIFIAFAFAFYNVIGYSFRVIWRELILRNGVPTWPRGNLLIVSDSSYAEELITQMRRNGASGYEIVGAVITDKSDVSQIAGVPVVTSLEKASEYICQQWIDSIYIHSSLTDKRIVGLMEDCRQMALPVHFHIPTFSEDGAKQFVEKIGGTFVLTTTANYATSLQSFTKRVVDIIGGLVGSVLALIIMLIVGPKIKKASPGPILYKQERIGKNGKHFKIIKIRSMYMDADERKKELAEQNKVKDGMMFKLDFDPRIIGNEILPDGTKKTGIGEFIRKYSLDEFPQFFNVLMGQMSLVGTRPPTCEEWDRYQFHHRARLSCKPGITGMWQVSGRSNITDFEEVVRLDTEYITNWSFGLDLKILLKTIRVVLFHEGAM